MLTYIRLIVVLIQFGEWTINYTWIGMIKTAMDVFWRGLFEFDKAKLIILIDNIIFSYEIVKPLGHVEIVQSPYVTESTRISVILPVFEHQVEDSVDFIIRYNNTCMSNKDNTLLKLVSRIFLRFYESFRNIFSYRKKNRFSCTILIHRIRAKKTFLIDWKS